jgi:hypothetical protein
MAIGPDPLAGPAGGSEPCFDPVADQFVGHSNTSVADDPWEPSWEPTIRVTGPRQAISSHCDYTARQAISSTTRARLEVPPKQ